jgi:hypothetical protein
MCSNCHDLALLCSSSSVLQSLAGDCSGYMVSLSMHIICSSGDNSQWG